MDLVQYIKSKINITHDECISIDRAFKKEDHTKGTQLLKQDSYSKKIFFIEKGLMRTYYYKEEKDITHFFFDENDFMMAVESVYFNQPSPFAIEVLENTTLRVINFDEFNAFFENNVALRDLRFFLAMKYLKQFSDRLYSIQFQTAEERYKHIIEEYPNILLRAPLGHIASYLGITQQTLSVIRRNK